MQKKINEKLRYQHILVNVEKWKYGIKKKSLKCCNRNVTENATATLQNPKGGYNPPDY